MNKDIGFQTFGKYGYLDHVYKSNMLKVVDNNTVIYEKDFNGHSGDDVLVISKYMKLCHLEKSVKEHTFFFSSPIGWLDPFELLFYQPEMSIMNEPLFTIHACCFACNDIDNEEGFWQIWSKNEVEPIVRVTYDVKRLLESLNDQADNQYSFYLAGMKYEAREEIFKKKSNNQSIPYESIDEYLNKLCFKRTAYKYENELRLFVKRTINNGFNDTETVIPNIYYNEGLIVEITLPPAEPFGNSHPAKDKMRKYQNCINAWTKQRLQKLVDEGLLKCKLTQSSLYCTDVRKRTYKA